MELSKRLKTVADMVGGCHTVTDIGTDHGYLPVWLINNNMCEHVYASDINEGPLKQAKENAAKYCRDVSRISFIRSDGLCNVPDPEGEDNGLVVCGMGGPLISGILSGKTDKTGPYLRFVFSPHSMIPEFRSYIGKNGFCIIDEKYIVEQGKLYVIINAVKGKDACVSETDTYFGPFIQKALRQDEVAGIFMDRYKSLMNLLNKRDLPENRRIEIEHEYDLYREVLKQ